MRKKISRSISVLLEVYVFPLCVVVSSCQTFQFVLTNITLEPELFWDSVQADQRCVSDVTEDVGKDGWWFNAVTDGWKRK